MEKSRHKLKFIKKLLIYWFLLTTKKSQLGSFIKKKPQKVVLFNFSLIFI